MEFGLTGAMAIVAGTALAVTVLAPSSHQNPVRRMLTPAG